jgi:hypothetical protein
MRLKLMPPCHTFRAFIGGVSHLGDTVRAHCGPLVRPINGGNLHYHLRENSEVGLTVPQILRGISEIRIRSR